MEETKNNKIIEIGRCRKCGKKIMARNQLDKDKYDYKIHNELRCGDCI